MRNESADQNDAQASNFHVPKSTSRAHFDEAHFRRRILSDCPQLGLDDEHKGSVFTWEPVKGMAPHTNQTYTNPMDIWNLELTKVDLMEAAESRGMQSALAGLSFTIFGSWHKHNDSPELWRDFGGLLLMRPDAVSYAKEVGSTLPEVCVGAHLRTDFDICRIIPDDQVTRYIEVFLKIPWRAISYTCISLVVIWMTASVPVRLQHSTESPF